MKGYCLRVNEARHLCPFVGRSLRYHKRRGRRTDIGRTVTVSTRTPLRPSPRRAPERERGDWAIIDGKTIYKLPGRRERGPSVCSTKRWEGQKPDQKWLNKTAGAGGAVGECLVLGPERLHNDPTNGILALAEMTSSHHLTLISVQVSAVLEGYGAGFSWILCCAPSPASPYHPPPPPPTHHHHPTPHPHPCTPTTQVHPVYYKDLMHLPAQGAGIAQWLERRTRD